MSYIKGQKPTTLREHIRSAMEMDAQRPIHCVPDCICYNLKFSSNLLRKKEWRRIDIIIHDKKFAGTLVAILEELMSGEYAKSQVTNRKATKIGWGTDTSKGGRLVVQCVVGDDLNEKGGMLEMILYNAITQTLYNYGLQSTRSMISSIHDALGGVTIQRQSPWYPIFQKMRDRNTEGQSGIVFNTLLDSYLCASEWVGVGTVHFYRYTTEPPVGKGKKEKIVWTVVKTLTLSDMFLFKDEKENEKIAMARSRVM